MVLKTIQKRQDIDLVYENERKKAKEEYIQEMKKHEAQDKLLFVSFLAIASTMTAAVIYFKEIRK